jgi:hypothetical protein
MARSNGHGRYPSHIVGSGVRDRFLADADDRAMTGRLPGDDDSQPVIEEHGSMKRNGESRCDVSSISGLDTFAGIQE